MPGKKAGKSRPDWANNFGDSLPAAAAHVPQVVIEAAKANADNASLIGSTSQAKDYLTAGEITALKL